MYDLYSSIFNFYSILFVVGLVVAWVTPLRKQFKFFKMIHISLIVGQIIIGVFGILLGGVGFLASLPFMAISAFSLWVKKQINETALKMRNNDISETNIGQTSRKNLKNWYLLIGIMLIVGLGAYLVDIQKPSDLDQLTDTNDSAQKILLATLIVTALLSIGARYSYMKFSRINQADLIANAIKSNTQPSTSSTDSISVVPQVQNTEDRLRKLESLLSNKLVSQEEYEQKKKQIIDSI